MKWLTKITFFLLHPLLMPIYGIGLFFLLTPLYFPNDFKISILLASLLLAVSIPLIIYTGLQSMRLCPKKEAVVQRERLFILGHSVILIFLYNKLIITLSNDLKLLTSFILVGYGMISLGSLFRKSWSIRMMFISVLISFVVCLSFIYQINYTLFVGILVVVSGWIASCELYRDTSLQGVIWGGLSGCVPQLLAFYYLYFS